MEEVSPLLHLGALFHGILFSYQKGLARLLTTSVTSGVSEYMIPYMDKIFSRAQPMEIGKLDETLQGFGEFLVKSELVEDVKVERAQRGFSFSVEGCIFADHIHDLLQPKDVTCPYGLVAYYLAEKATGLHVKKALSEFTPTSSTTSIEFNLEPSNVDAASAETRAKEKIVDLVEDEVKRRTEEQRLLQRFYQR